MSKLDFPFAHGGPLANADFRSSWQDFVVVEELGFVPSGEGEHIYLQITKRGTNSHWLAKRIAQFAGVRERDVGYCGQKDRHAVTTQWFSVYRPGDTALSWDELSADADLSIDILTVTRGEKKLRRGQHAANYFEITLRNFDVPAPTVDALLQQIRTLGVPNYFGEQRFGRDGNNLVAATEWVEGGRLPRSREKKAILLSTARAYLFNTVLAERVRRACWATVIEGDAEVDSVATGPMWGRGRSSAADEALVIEQSALESLTAWLDRMEHCGLNQDRRMLVLHPQGMQWQFEEGVLTLSFGLRPGQFATSVLREVAVLNNRSLDLAVSP